LNVKQLIGDGLLIIERDDKDMMMPCKGEVSIENNDNIICIRSGQIDSNKKITGIGIKISLYPLYDDE